MNKKTAHIAGSMSGHLLWSCLFAMLPILCGCATALRGVAPTVGIGNYAAVSDQLHRGSQPDRDAIDQLARLGVRTILNLRMPHDAWSDEAAYARSKGLGFVQVPLSGWRAPKEEDIEKVLALISASLAPVFVHCEHGADRTGLVVACYRIRKQGWPVERALEEAEKHGMSPFQVGMKNFIRQFAAGDRSKGTDERCPGG